jgi:hypothetical protein
MPSGKRNVLWFSAGLQFACTKCARCCYGARQAAINVNAAEQLAIAAYMKIPEDEFRSNYMIPKYAIALRNARLCRPPAT